MMDVDQETTGFDQTMDVDQKKMAVDQKEMDDDQKKTVVSVGSQATLAPITPEVKAVVTTGKRHSGLNPTRTRSLPLLQSRDASKSVYMHTCGLVEVFSIRIDNFHETERRCELYGSVEVVDVEGCLKLYDRPREKPEHISANRTISLIGPHVAIQVLSGFAVNLDLRYVNGSDDSEDVDVAKWQLSWDIHKPEIAYTTRGKFLSDFCNKPDKFASQGICSVSPIECDKRLTTVFREQNGCVVSLHYAILEHAVQAHVQVEIIHLDAEEDFVQYDVRGSLSAKYRHLENDSDSDSVSYLKDHRFRTTLLNTGLTEYVKAERWKKIQLARHVMAVPAYTRLIIEADMWHGCSESRCSIAKGSVEIEPSESGCSVEYITGDDRLGIRLLVEWTPHASIVKNFSYTPVS